MGTIERIYQIFNKLKLIGVWISGIALVGMMFFIVLDVILRNVFSNSINGGFEIVQNYFMPLAVFPALAYIYSSGVLPKMDILLERFSEKFQKFIIVVMLLMEVFVLAIMFQFTMEYAISGLERKMSFPAAGSLYPVYPLFFFVTIGFFMILIENIFVLIRNFTQEKATFLFEEK